jgi:hypothetical protein
MLASLGNDPFLPAPQNRQLRDLCTLEVTLDGTGAETRMAVLRRGLDVELHRRSHAENVG